MGFEGEFFRGQMIQGQMTYQDGSLYNGSWVDGMRHGRGKCIFVDGSEYEGDFRKGKFHGHGKMTWNDRGWYVGNWCEGEIHGRGKEVRPDGSLRHDGEWERGQPNPICVRNSTNTATTTGTTHNYGNGLGITGIPTLDDETHDNNSCYSGNLKFKDFLYFPCESAAASYFI